jgi:hypothetical protein
VLLYVPLGVGLWRRPLAFALLAAALLSGACETVQVWAFERFSSPLDVLANTLGAGLGVAAARRLAQGRAVRPDTLPLDRRTVAAALLGTVLLLAAWAWPAAPSSLANWDGSHELLLGNERTGDRPWRGRIATLALLPGALSGDEVREFADFTGPAAQAALHARGAFLLPAPLSLHGGDASRIPAEAARRFFDLAVAGNAFTVLATLTPADIVQTGPARIVSFSHDPYHRNFDLGQQGERLVFRVRTPISGPNGANPRTESPALLQAGRQLAVAASFDGRVARLYVDGRARARGNVAAAGCALPSLCDSDLPVATALFGALLAAVALGWAGPASRRHALSFALLAGALGAALLHGLNVGQGVVPFEGWVALMVLAGAGCVGMAAGAPHARPRPEQPASMA